MEHAKRFRALLSEIGLSHLQAAKHLHVSLRTLQNWLSGRHEVPYASYKLLRLLRYMELPGPTWTGWHFSRGMLVTPEGRTLDGTDAAWWSLLVRQARCFRAAYRRSGELERALMELAAAGQGLQTPAAPDVMSQGGSADRPAMGTPGTGGTWRAGRDVPVSVAGGAAQPPALIYLLGISRPLRNQASIPDAPMLSKQERSFPQYERRAPL